MSFWKAFIVSQLVIAMIIIARSIYSDRRNLKRIRTYCEDFGCENVNTEIRKNHYSVTFQKRGRTYRAKCQVSYPRIEWLANDPAEVGASP